MLKNISSIIFAVITLVWKKPLYRAIYIAYSLKFGETLAAKAVGNPELSLEWPGKCRDLTGIKSERYLEDKVHTIGKPMDKMSFDSKPYPISGGNRWNICSWVDRIRGSKKRNGQLSLFRIDMKGAVNA